MNEILHGNPLILPQFYLTKLKLDFINFDFKYKN